MTRRLRVGYVIGALSASGSERQILALAERLPRDRFEPEFVLLSRADVNADRAAAAGIPIHVVPPPIRRASTRPPAALWRTWQKALNFVRLVRRRRYDVVDAWLFHAYVLAALTRPATRVPILVTGRRSLASAEPHDRRARWLKRLSLFMSDAVVANSPQVLADAAALGSGPTGRLRLIANGVEIPELRADAGRAVRAELGLPLDAVIFGVVANLNPGKGHDTLLEAMAALADGRPSAMAVLIGDGELRPGLELRVAELGLHDRVRFIGAVRDVMQILPAVDVVVQASHSEGLPNALLEAGAAARPIIATPVGGTTEIVRDGATGLLVPVGDPRRLAAAMGRLLDEPDLRSLLGNAARAQVAASFGMDRLVTAYSDLYLELAARRGLT